MQAQPIDFARAASLVARMREARDSLRSLMGESYPGRVAEFRSALREVADRKGQRFLEFAVAAASLAQREGEEAAVLWILAAAVEEIEAGEVA